MNRRLYTKWLAAWLAVLLAAVPAIACAQSAAAMPGVMDAKKFFSDMLGGKTTPAPAASTSSQEASIADLQPSAEALNELKVDSQCRHVQKDFNVWDKALGYAGADAQRRLQTLIASNFQYDQLSESDKRFLRYLAYTTVWVPASVESKIGQLYAAVSTVGGGNSVGGSGRATKKAMERIAQRLGEMRGRIDGFPGAVSAVLNTAILDGAFAQVGGLIVISPRFLNMMDEKDDMRDVVLARMALT